MGKISLKEMNNHKVEKIESNDLKTSNDMRELELKANYDRLGDFILTKLHGNYEFTIPKQAFMEKVFNKFTKEGKEYSEAHKDDYRKDEDLHIQLKIVPGFGIYRTGLGPETEIAKIDHPNHAEHWGIDYGRIPFTVDMMSHASEYEFDMAIKFSDKLEYLEKGSKDRWIQKNADKFANVEDAGDYYDKNWYLLTDVDYYKENLIRTSRGDKIQKDQRNVVYGNKKEYNDVFYTKPRAVLTVNGKEVGILPEQLREKTIELAKEQDGAVKYQPLTDKQADSLMNLISKQAQHIIELKKKELIELTKKVNKENRGVWAYVNFNDKNNTCTLDLQSDMIENESTIGSLDRRSLEAAKREVKNFVKWHEVAIREEESERTHPTASRISKHQAIERNAEER